MEKPVHVYATTTEACISSSSDQGPFANSQEVDLAKKEKGVLTKKSGDQIITDSVIDLLGVNDNHIIYRLPLLIKHCSDHWQALGYILLSSTKPKVIELAALGV